MYFDRRKGWVAEWFKAVVLKTTNTITNHQIIIINQIDKFFNFSIIYLHIRYTVLYHQFFCLVSSTYTFFTQDHVRSLKN